MTPDDCLATPDIDVLVVGAGIAGLTVALNLAEAGARVLVLEADSVVGGCVRLHDVAGLGLDRGADSFAMSRPAVGDLAARLGLETEAPMGGPAWVRHTAGFAPLPAATLLGIPAHPLAADVRRAVGLCGAVRAAFDAVLPREHAPVTAGLGALVRRRMGRRVLDRLVAPIAAGVYSSRGADLDLDAVAPGLTAKLEAGQSLSRAVADLRRGAPPSGSAVRGITGGMGRLSQTLAAAARAAGTGIECGAPVSAIRRDGAGWNVDVAGPSPTRFTAPQVVVATQAGVAARLVAGASAGALALPLREAADVAVVTLVVAAPGLDAAPRGSGVLVAPGAPALRAKALTHVTAKWDWAARAAGLGRHVLRLSFGRSGGAEDDGAGNGSRRSSRSGAMDGAGTRMVGGAGADGYRAGNRGGRAAPAGGGPATASDRPAPADLPALADLGDADLLAAARRDAAALTGTRIAEGDVMGGSVVRYPDRLAAPRAGFAREAAAFRESLAHFPGLAVVGASVTGTGLAAVVTDATAAAVAIGRAAGCTM